MEEDGGGICLAGVRNSLPEQKHRSAEPSQGSTSLAAGLAVLLARFCLELSLLRVSDLFLPLCRFFLHSHHLDLLL